MGLIYMRTSPSGKSYIGQTIKDEQLRWKEHCYEALHDNMPGYNSKLSKAIRKYGPDAFTVTILEECSNADLNNQEQYWIQFYNTYQMGYNSTLGGNSGNKYSDEVILQLWNEGLNQQAIADQLSCHRDTINKRLQHLIPESERKQRHDMTANNTLNSADQEEILKLWHENKSIRTIADETHHDRKVISKWLKKLGISADAIEARGRESSRTNRTTRHIAQYSKTGELLRVFNSMAEAVSALGICNTTIDKIIAGRSRKYNGIIFLKNIEVGE